jgi:hypothetical protein
MHLHRCFTMNRKNPKFVWVVWNQYKHPLFLYHALSEPQFKLRASPAVLSLSYLHSKILMKKTQNMPVWFRKLVLAPFTVPDKMRSNAVCTSLKECNKFDLTVLLSVFLIGLRCLIKCAATLCTSLAPP